MRILKELSYQLTGAQLGITITAVLIGFIAKPTVASMLESPVRSIVGESAKETVSLVVAIVLQLFQNTCLYIIDNQIVTMQKSATTLLNAIKDNSK